MFFHSFKFVLGSHKLVSLAAILSLILYILFDIVYADSPELFSYGGDIANLISNISVTFFNGYIFYMVITTLSVNDRLEFQREYSLSVIKKTAAHSARFFHAFKENMPLIPTDEILSDISNGLKFSDPVRISVENVNNSGKGRDLNVYEYMFEYYHNEMIDFIKSSQYYLNLVDPKVGSQLINIFNSELFRMVSQSDKSFKNHLRTELDTKFANYFSTAIFEFRNCVSNMVDSHKEIYGDFDLNLLLRTKIEDFTSK
ncbi:MAG: hypothetical protein V7690_14025 [Shewanella sp.]|uniref:hypothetical protein n=1 Tax=Shewanella sp. TaxID=50422 RepID=UPI00300212A4